MLDILEIAQEDGMQLAMRKNLIEILRNKVGAVPL
jgi:hypothetical protein